MNPLCLVGPTACGKSAVALLLAERLNGEIISVDSMQVYCGLDIGTAKPSPAERSRVPHHLIDVCHLSTQFDAAEFVRLAQAAISEIKGRDRVPILCGGTGLYFKALLEGLGTAPPANDTVRRQLESIPLNTLLAELERSDPVTFARIDHQNPRRVIRALEVIRITGRPFSDLRAPWNLPGNVSNTLAQNYTIIGLQRTALDLRARIDARVNQMFTLGLVEETRALLTKGLALNRTAMQAIGYRQVVDHLNGVMNLPATIDLIKIRTRQFAKRQMTWFRRQLPVEWLKIEPVESAEQIAAHILNKMKQAEKEH